MSAALTLAKLGPWPNPNPQVGCVIVDSTGRVLATGCHLGRGTPHAEVAALQSLVGQTDGLSQLPDLASATAYVTLEPCNHQGVTGPCAEALIAAGLGTVVYGYPDPNPVAAGGAARLAAAGVQVVADFVPAITDFYREWATTVREQRPYVIAKVAATLDGFTAAVDGSSQWITGELARADVHQQRAGCDTILVGTGTVIADNPRLTVRGVAGATNPTRVVVGRRELPADRHIFNGEAATLTYQTHDLASVLPDLYEQGYRRTYVEGGSTVTTAMLAADLVDEVHYYLAPALLGSGRSAINDLGITSIGQARRLQLVDVTQFGADVRFVLQVKETPCLPD